MVKQVVASRRSLEMNYPIREVSAFADQIAAGGKKLIRFNIGDPNKWDFQTPEYFKQALRDAVDNTDNGYGESMGNPEFRKAIVDREFEKHGSHIPYDKVFVTSGVGEGIQLLMGTLVEPGDEIMVPGPGYPSYIQYVNFFGGKVVPYRMIEEENWNPDTDMLRKRISKKTKAIVVINPNNPTGAVFSEKTLREIANIAAEYNIPVISDEIYDKIIMRGKFFSFSRMPSDVSRIVLNGFSKVNLMPGWRIGYGYFMDEKGILDDVFNGLMKQLRARICPNVPCQWAAQASLQGPQDYIVEMNAKLKSREEYSFKRLNEIPGIETQMGNGAFYLFPKIDLGGVWKSDFDFVKDLIMETGLVFVHGSGFCDEFGQSHFRTITLPKLEILEDAYDKLEKFMRMRLKA